MKHIDEHTLELYILDAPEVSKQKDAIRSHLRDCAGCRSIEGRLREVYDAAAQAHEEFSNMEGSVLPARIRQNGAIDHIWDTGASSLRPLRQPVWTMVRRYVSDHPLGALGGGALALGAVAGVLVLALNSSLLSPAPSFAHPNTEQDLIEVYAKDRTKLWSIPASSLRSWEAENDGYATSRIEVADLKGNGNGALVTTAPLAGMPTSPARVRAFDSPDQLLFEREIGGPVDFRGHRYVDHMDARPLVIVPASDGKGSDIIVAASAGRSPTVVARLNSDGEVLGEYWHFGTLYGLYGIDLDGDGQKEIIASGTSDVADTLDGNGSSHGVVVVLDPRKLIGRHESQYTPGFGFSPSDAERAYVRIPRSDVNDALGISSGVRYVRATADSLLLVKVESGGPLKLPVFDYYLTRHLKVAWVSSTDMNAPLYERLKAEGKIRSSLDSTYLTTLAGRVEVLLP